MTVDDPQVTIHEQTSTRPSRICRCPAPAAATTHPGSLLCAEQQADLLRHRPWQRTGIHQRLRLPVSTGSAPGADRDGDDDPSPPNTTPVHRKEISMTSIIEPSTIQTGTSRPAPMSPAPLSGSPILR